MNPLQRKLATALAVSIATLAGAACATTGDKTASSAIPAPSTLAQATPPAIPPSTTAAATATPSPGASSATTTRSSTAAPLATPAPSTSNNGTSSDSAASTQAASGANASEDSQARRIFDQLDANHDGTLTFDEFSRATFRAK